MSGPVSSRGSQADQRAHVVAAMPADMAPALEQRALPGVTPVGVPADGDLATALADVEFLVLDHDRRHDVVAVLPSLGSLRVVQLLIAGTDWVGPLPDGVRLCRSVGARNNGVAEWVASAVLGLASGLLKAVRDQHEQRWRRVETDELSGTRAVLAGAGPVALATRDLLARLGVDVTVVARTARAGVHAVSELPALVANADALVLLLPDTPETRGLVDAAVLARLPDGATIVNAGRGSVVDTEALTAEVKRGRLRTVLDVTDPEPLPPDHPLWTLPGCYLSPHSAGATRQGRRRAIEYALDQLARYVRGEPL